MLMTLSWVLPASGMPTSHGVLWGLGMWQTQCPSDPLLWGFKSWTTTQRVRGGGAAAPVVVSWEEGSGIPAAEIPRPDWNQASLCFQLLGATRTLYINTISLLKLDKIHVIWSEQTLSVRANNNVLICQALFLTFLNVLSHLIPTTIS